MAAIAFLVAAIPALLEAKRTAIQTQRLLQALEKEVPDTAAAMRLASMEMSDAIEEVSLLGNDLSSGLRASARLATDMHASVQQGGMLLSTAASSVIMPQLRKRTPPLRASLELQLQETARLRYNAAMMGQMARTAALSVRRVRAAMSSAGLVQRAVSLARLAQFSRLHRQRPDNPERP